MKIKKFHQFIALEKGPINTAIVDFLKGDVYQIGNGFIEKFLDGDYQEIQDFIRMLEQEELCFDANPGDWIPNISFDEIKDDSIYVQIEDGVDVKSIHERFSDYRISISIIMPGEKEFSRCQELLKREGDFQKIDELHYNFNRNFNSCWGKKITILKDRTARPCKHSRIILGDIFHDDVNVIVDKANEYWKLTKDKVEKCKNCELRYICFDCREIALREGGKISSANPYCKYDPLSGNWFP
jgi:radical SAM protein with 4Fe4S-binding SPASM domain